MTVPISIIIPLFNTEKYIKETIQSVLNQTFENFELIIVNDGSYDDSLFKVQQFSDPRIKVFTKKNEGVSIARNFGFNESSGRYIAFLDSDDIWERNKLRKSYDFLENNKEFGLVHTGCQRIDEFSKPLNAPHAGSSGWILEELLRWEGLGVPAPCSNILVRKEVLKRSGLFDPRISMAADQDILFRLAKICKIGCLPETMVFYRIHGRNMHLNIQEMEKGHLYVYNKALESKIIKSNHDYRNYLANLYYIFSGDYWRVKKDLWNALRCAYLSILHNPRMMMKFVKKINVKKSNTVHI